MYRIRQNIRGGKLSRFAALKLPHASAMRILDRHIDQLFSAKKALSSISSSIHVSYFLSSCVKPGGEREISG